MPTYVIDAPGGGGKIPVMPNYLISYSDHKVVLRNYEGYITTYEEPLSTSSTTAGLHVLPHRAPSRASAGVHGLLQGEQMWIEPAGFEEVHTRGNVEAHRLQRPEKWVPYGVGALEGTARAPLPRSRRSRNGGAGTNGGPTTEYGPGEEPRPREGEPTASAHGELL